MTDAPQVKDVAAGSTPAPRGAAERYVLVDLMRVLAIVAVLWIHTPESPELRPFMDIGRFAVPFFVIVSVVFLGQSLRRDPLQKFSQYALSRFWRLYVPFLAWSIIYLAARWLKHVALVPGMPIVLGPSFFFAGSSHQLWFLPFLLASNLMLFWVLRVALGNPTVSAVVSMAALLLAFGASFLPLPGEMRDIGTEHFLVASIYALPSLFLGVAIAAMFSKIEHVLRLRVSGLLALGLLVSVTMLILYSGRNGGLEAVAGLGAFVLALQPASVGRWVSTLGKRAFDAYLNHVLFIELLQALLRKLHISASWQSDVMIFALAVLISFIVGALIARYGPSFLVAGDAPRRKRPEAAGQQ